MSKPILFIGSSSEAAPIVEEYEAELSSVADVRRWDKGAFRLSQYTMEGLKAAAMEADFALFVLGQDDFTESRGQILPSPRDNVVFEGGFFTPVLGCQRVFYSVDSRGSKIPSDWKGLGYTTHDTSTEGRARVARSAYNIRQEIARQRFKPANHHAWRDENEAAFDQAISGSWVDFITNRDDRSVVGHFAIRVEADGVKIVDGRAWNRDGKPQAKFWSQSVRTRSPDLFYSWKGEHPRSREFYSHFGAGEVRFTVPEGGGRATEGQGKFSVTPEANPLETELLHRALRRPEPQDEDDLRSDDPERIGPAVRRLLERWKSAF